MKLPEYVRRNRVKLIAVAGMIGGVGFLAGYASAEIA